jgi:undecaprenyl-diphosphatase
MEWLLNLDVDLFRFINGTLSNPFFDRLMPFVSGNVFFIPALVVLGALLVWKGRERGLVCVLMLGIIVGTCDGVTCRIIKRAVGRPRPFNVLPDVNRPGGPVSSSSSSQNKSDQKIVERTGTIPPNPAAVTGNSMPSAHAANWFAGTMVALVYYRKSIRVMLPLACLVSFSRIYNGVHYPSDVLAGAIVGAGHAAAMLWLLNALWRWSGPKWFPRAWNAMPFLTFLDKKPSSPS